MLGTYRRFYGAARLAPGTRIRYPYAGPVHDDGERRRVRCRRTTAGSSTPGGSSDARVCRTSSARSPASVETTFGSTLVGGDTETGAARAVDAAAARAGDRRRRADRVARPRSTARRSPRRFVAHHVVAIPSLWECWPYAALEPLHLNRPVLATPVGGLVELVAPGRSGWLAPVSDAVALGAGAGVAVDSTARARGAGPKPLTARAWRASSATSARSSTAIRRWRAAPATPAGSPRARAATAAAGVRDRPVLPGVTLRARRDRVAAGADVPAAGDRARQRRLVRGGGLDRRRDRRTSSR